MGWDGEDLALLPKPPLLTSPYPLPLPVPYALLLLPPLVGWDGEDLALLPRPPLGAELAGPLGDPRRSDFSR